MVPNPGGDNHAIVSRPCVICHSSPAVRIDAQLDHLHTRRSVATWSFVCERCLAHSGLTHQHMDLNWLVDAADHSCECEPQTEPPAHRLMLGGTQFCLLACTSQQIG